MGRNDQMIKQLDWITVLLYLLFLVLGWLTIYSASYSSDHPSMVDVSQEYGKQLIWIGVCLVLGATILMIEGSFFLRYALPIYFGTILLLIAVLIFGKEVNGAKAWFGVGSFGIQPSEFAKFSTCLIVAKYLNGVTVSRVKLSWLQVVFKEVPGFLKAFFSFIGGGGGQLVSSIHATLVPLTLVALPALLIMLQPDTGTVLVFVAFIFVLYREGLAGNLFLFGLFAVVISVLSLIIKDTYLQVFGINKFISGQWFLIALFLVAGIVIALLVRQVVYRRDRKRVYIWLTVVVLSSALIVKAVGFVFDNVLQSHQQERIEITLGLKEDPSGAGYNVNQSMAAIGSGGFSGKGYLEGTLSNARNKHVPMQSTDFIFCSVGEEWGTIGGVTLVTLFLILLFRIIIIAERQRSRFTRIYAYGVAGIIFFHFAINVAMTIGLAPVIGIPLPMFSYGGSSLIGFTILLFILLRMDSERMNVLR